MFIKQKDRSDLSNDYISMIFLNVLAVLIVSNSSIPALAVFFHQFALEYFALSKEQKITFLQTNIRSGSFIGSPIFSAMLSAVEMGITKIKLSYISLRSVPHQTGNLPNTSFKVCCLITKTGIFKSNRSCFNFKLRFVIVSNLQSNSSAAPNPLECAGAGFVVGEEHAFLSIGCVSLKKA